ncbi:hypothetical protein NE619_04820 [Anaerovorax odorimutans]|uniref:Uncharacterized protein n=1 Tax=Anaerovorax odorimutans TaxID=109327 RepID=A0ABT1RLI3_9FIRM|nr:hypothetical protein [Anaerovorax odorimutans]MCQ4636040.1 hypothetical protein [Anaerovorax odorimutans]
MRGKKIRNVLICCAVVVAAAVLIRFSGLDHLDGVVAPKCEGNGTCGMKYFKKLLNEQEDR